MLGVAPRQRATMPNTKTKARYRSKRRSCSLCKPAKVGRADRRDMQWRRADERLLEERMMLSLQMAELG
jgi:hypothetical protein